MTHIRWARPLPRPEFLFPRLLAAQNGIQLKQRPRGFLGLEWLEQGETSRRQVEVRGVLKGSPAASGGLQPGDRILRINQRAIKDLKGACAALSEVQPRDVVAMVVRRGTGVDSHELTLTLTAGEGL